MSSHSCQRGHDLENNLQERHDEDMLSMILQFLGDSELRRRYSKCKHNAIKIIERIRTNLKWGSAVVLWIVLWLLISGLEESLSLVSFNDDSLGGRLNDTNGGWHHFLAPLTLFASSLDVLFWFRPGCCFVLLWEWDDEISFIRSLLVRICALATIRREKLRSEEEDSEEGPLILSSFDDGAARSKINTNVKVKFLLHCGKH